VTELIKQEFAPAKPAPKAKPKAPTRRRGRRR